MDWGQEILLGLIAVFALFLIVQLVSVIIGSRITRNITGAVHDLYEGTQKVKEGDSRIASPFKAQINWPSLAAPSSHDGESGALDRGGKEEERLHSELQIARQVQRQLFPSASLATRSICMMGVCHPAQVVLRRLLRLSPASRDPRSQWRSAM